MTHGGEHSSVEVCNPVLEYKVLIPNFPKAAPDIDEDALFDCELEDVAMAPATRLPRVDEHSSVEVWKPVLKSKFFKAVPDVDADSRDGVVPIAACAPELRNARFFVSW